MSGWQDRAAAKRASQLNKIPAAWRIPNCKHVADTDLRLFVLSSGILSSLEIAITEMASVVDLLRCISTKAYTAIEVVTAFCKRAAIAHQL